MSLKIDKVINKKDLGENDIVVLKFDKSFSDFESIKLITNPLKKELKNLVIAIRADMEISTLDEKFMNSQGWYKQKQIKDKI